MNVLLLKNFGQSHKMSLKVQHCYNGICGAKGVQSFCHRVLVVLSSTSSAAAVSTAGKLLQRLTTVWSCKSHCVSMISYILLWEKYIY